MRQWNVDPKAVCRQHLLGEHVEHHMFMGSIAKGVDMSGYVQNNLLELGTLNARHDELVIEMTRRGYNHKSPLYDERAYMVVCFPYTLVNVKIDVASASEDLFTRCLECRALRDADPSLRALYSKP